MLAGAGWAGTGWPGCFSLFAAEQRVLVVALFELAAFKATSRCVSDFAQRLFDLFPLNTGSPAGAIQAPIRPE